MWVMFPQRECHLGKILGFECVEIRIVVYVLTSPVWFNIKHLVVRQVIKFVICNMIII